MRRVWVLFLVAVAACSSGDSTSGPDGGPDPDADGGGQSGQGGESGHSGQGGHSGGGSGGSMSTPDGGDEDASVPEIPGVMALRIEPASLDLMDDGVAPGETGEFHAIGVFEDGERDVTNLVAWSLEDDELAAISDGEVTTAGFGGQTRVIARAAGVEDDADLTVALDVQTSTEGAPDGIVELFDSDPADDVEVDDDMLRVIYPSDETMFPRNLERVDHQWRADASFDRFEVRFESDLALVRFYTDQKHLLPDLDGWHWLANTHAGRSLQMSVRATSSTAPDMIVRSKPITLYYSRSEVIGALYYWSTGAQGVLKATISSPVATKFFTDPSGDDTTCVSCHTVSRNGQKLSAGYGGEKLRAINVADRSLLIPSEPTAMGAEYGWGTFNPDASRLLYASKGLLTLLDANNGDALDPVALPMMKLATHPDWAPNGDHVAIAYGARLDNKNAQGTSIARMAVDGDTFEEPEVLLASTGDTDTMIFPSYAPNSAWIAFARGVGKSKDNVTNTIALLPADGGDPIPLTRMNERVRHEDGITGIGNNMPTWAPSSKPGIFWIAFSSLRAYGDVLEEGRDQLWAVAIDPEKIGTGEDPSYAAFWLPFQDLNEGNHRAFWAIDTEAECPGEIEICDDLDNDCDGVVDEECCTPSAETCDLEDNNCDGVVDEGCCEASPEVCGDGIDNDCDLVEDEGCCEASDEVCDGVDNNCDGVADEGCCVGDDEICDNEIDDDCDDLVDELCVQ